MGDEKELESLIDEWSDEDLEFLEDEETVTEESEPSKTLTLAEPDDEPSTENGREDYGKRAEKRIRKLVADRNAAQAEADQMRLERDSYATQAQTSFTGVLSANDEHIKSETASLKSQMKIARENEDDDEFFNLSQRQADLAVRKSAVDAAKAKQRYQQQAPPQQQYAPPPRPQQEAVNWATKNQDWFNSQGADPKSAAALAINNQLLNEGYDHSSHDFYSELDSRLGTAFGNKPRGTPVAGATNRATKRTTISDVAKILSPRQIAYAKRNGISIKEYAKEVVRMQKSGDLENMNDV